MRPLNFVISRRGSDEKSYRSLSLLGTWISPFGRNDRKSALFRSPDIIYKMDEFDISDISQDIELDEMPMYWQYMQSFYFLL